MSDFLHLGYNLQFFGDESVGEEVSEAAEPTDVTDTAADVVESEESEGVEEQESTEPAFDRDAIAASARRESEARIKAMDAEFTRRFGNLKNPVTGKAITNAQEYLDALDAQESIKRNRELEEKGIDPSIIDRAVANNPMVRQAQQLVEASQQMAIQKQIEMEVAEIHKLDPSINTFADIEQNENRNAILEMVQKGYSLYDSYRLANYDSLMGKASNSAKQAAINQAKGKNHLTPTSSGAATNDGLVDIPASEIDRWKAFFPNASMKELKEKYNRTHKTK